MKATARPILTAVRCRCYSAQAASERAVTPTRTRQEPKVVHLSNGAIVAAAETYSPVVRLAILYNAGSRYETKENAGITHVLRNATNLSSLNATAFGITKHVQQMGGELTATTTRETMMVSMNCMRDDFFKGMEYMSHVARHPAFKPWELQDMSPTLKVDVARYHTDVEAMLMENLHEVAFRDTLGMSLYIPEYKIGSYDYDDVLSFANKHFVPSNMAVVAMGMDAEEFAFQINKRWGFDKQTPVEAPKKAGAAYHGGEKRIETKDSLAHAAVVTEGASLGSKDLIPLALLQRIMGTGPTVKYSDNVTTSKINKAVAEAASGPFAASSINVNYTDSGLFGFYAVGQPKEIGAILKACAATFGNATKGGITEQELASAKNKLKSAIYMSLEDSDNALIEVGSQALLTGEVINPANVAGEIDKVTLANVQDVAKRIINGKPSMVAVGNLNHTPYLDQLL